MLISLNRDWTAQLTPPKHSSVSTLSETATTALHKRHFRTSDSILDTGMLQMCICIRNAYCSEDCQ